MPIDDASDERPKKETSDGNAELRNFLLDAIRSSQTSSTDSTEATAKDSKPASKAGSPTTLNQAQLDLAAWAPPTTDANKDSGFLVIEPLFKMPAKLDSTKPAGDSPSTAVTARTTAPTVAPDGGTWRKNEGGQWGYTNKDGTPEERFKGSTVTEVEKHSDGSLSIKFADSTAIKENADKTKVSYNAAGQVDKVIYADGRTREFKYDGDTMIAAKTRDDKWFDRQPSTNGYSDSWKVRGEFSAPWSGKINVDKQTGNYDYTPSTGEHAGIKFVSRTDEATEQRFSDGTKKVTFPNNCNQSFDAQGRLINMTTENGTVRSFGWTKEGGEDVLTSMVVKTKDATYDWKKQGDEWYRDGQKQNFDLSVDNGTGVYTWTNKDIGETTQIHANGKETTDKKGLIVESDHGKVVKSSNNEGTFEYKRDKKGELLELSYSNKDGSTKQAWKWDDKLGWHDGKGESFGTRVAISDNGEPVFEKNGRNTRIDHSGKSFSQSKDAKTGAVVETSEGLMRTQAANGMQREFHVATDGPHKGEPTRESRTIAGKTETWVREDVDGELTNNWRRMEDDKVETRTDLQLKENGELTYTVDSEKYSGSADGTEVVKNEEKKWQVTYKNGLAEEIKYADGKTRKFAYDDNRDVKSFEVTDEGDPTKSTWTRTGTDKWKSNSGTDWNAHIEIKRDSYEIKDLDDKNKVTVRTPDGYKREEFPDQKKILESVNGKLTKATIDGESRTFERDSAGEVIRIQDSHSQTSLEKQSDGTWALLDSKGTKIDDGFSRIGKPSVGEDGRTSFLVGDGRVLTHVIGQDAKSVGGKTDLDRQIVQSEFLQDEAKIRFVENLQEFSGRTDINDAEKKATLQQIERLLNNTSERVFKREEQWKIAEQLAWTCAHIDRDSQGNHPNCTLATLRNSMVRESPSTFTRMIADVSINGQFVTKDGTVITPPAASLVAGKEERSFPPDGASRTWVGQISDVTMANVHWQRRTTDPRGYSVLKGSVKYEEVRPTGKDDTGARIFLYSDSLNKAEVGKSLGFQMPQMLDIYSQVSGKDQTGRGIVHNSRTSGQGTAVVATVDELKTQLQKGPWPKIVQLQNNILNGKAADDDDHEHVVVVTGYDPKTGKLAVDNSHSTSLDLLTPDKQISPERLFAAMSAPTLAVRKYNEQLQRQNTTTYYYYNGVLYSR